MSVRTAPLLPLFRQVTPTPFVPADPKRRAERCREIFAIQVRSWPPPSPQLAAPLTLWCTAGQCNGLVKRLQHTNSQTVTIGVSGGLDSTLALLVAVKAFDRLKLNRR